jgi:branched-chain amino acid transport system ATP-binding protein
LATAIIEERFDAFDKLRQEISIVIVDHLLDLALSPSPTAAWPGTWQIMHIGLSKALSKDLDVLRKVSWL